MASSGNAALIATFYNLIFILMCMTLLFYTTVSEYVSRNIFSRPMLRSLKSCIDGNIGVARGRIPQDENWKFLGA